MSPEIHRPKTLEEAAALIQSDRLSLPLGGGSIIETTHELSFDAVDLQDLGLDLIEQKSRTLVIGAQVSLDSLLEAKGLPGALVEAINFQKARNVGGTATLAGSLVAADGTSPLASAMLALDAQAVLFPKKNRIGIGDLLNQRLQSGSLFYVPNKLITAFIVGTGIGLWYGQEPLGQEARPVVTVAVAEWPSGRRRIAVGGWGALPRLAFDGPQPGGEEVTVRSIAAESGDPYASAADRQTAAVELTKKALEHFEA